MQKDIKLSKKGIPLRSAFDGKVSYPPYTNKFRLFIN